jgi:hypothetical protein
MYRLVPCDVIRYGRLPLTLSIVRALLTEAGPDVTANVTALPELPPVAEREIGLTPYVTGVGGGAKVIVCGAWEIVTTTELAVAGL